MGTDKRSALGKGRLTLVSGSTTERTPSGQHFSAIEVVNLYFNEDAAPLLSWPAAMTMMALLALAGGYMARRRFVTGEQA
jgi:hypothetical protein